MDYLRLNESMTPLVASGFKSNFLFYVKEYILQQNVPTHKDILTCTLSLFTLLLHLEYVSQWEPQLHLASSLAEEK